MPNGLTAACGLKGEHPPMRTDRARQQQADVADVGAHIVYHHPGVYLALDSLLQLRLVRAQPVVFLGMQVKHQACPGQASGSHLDLAQAGGGGSV